MLRSLTQWFRNRQATRQMTHHTSQPTYAPKPPEHVHLHWHINDLKKAPAEFIWNANAALEMEDIVVDKQSPSFVYDEQLLENARTQWQFGDWESLIKLDLETIQAHPERAKLALLAAAGHQQMNNIPETKKFIALAREWGCDKGLVSRILIAGVHNTFGRVAAIKGDKDKVLKQFQTAIAVGAPGSELKLVTKARVEQQLDMLGLTTRHTALESIQGTKGLPSTYRQFSDLWHQQAITVNSSGQKLCTSLFVRNLHQLQQQRDAIGRRLLLCDAGLVTAESLQNSLLGLFNAQCSADAVLIVCDPINGYQDYYQQHGAASPAANFETYCQVLLDYLHSHPELTLIRYEDFFVEPDRTMRVLCAALALNFYEQFETLSDIFALSNGGALAETSLRGISAADHYPALCELLGYELNRNLIESIDKSAPNTQNAGTRYLFKNQELDGIKAQAEQEDRHKVSWARAVLQWQCNDWDSLSAIPLTDIYQHPDRARLALILASTYQQLDCYDKARELGRLAVKWGCPKAYMLQVMFEYVHNTFEHANMLIETLEQK